MTRFACLVLLPLLAALVPGGDEKPRTDLYGDPLPDGARARCGTVRLLARLAPGLAFSPDGKTLRTTGRDEVAFWDVATGGRLKALAVPDKEWVTATALSPDGKLLAGAGLKGAYLWDAGTHRLRRHLAGKMAGVLAFSADGEALVVNGEGDTVVVWSVADGKELRTLKTEMRSVDHVLPFPDGRTLFAFDQDEGTARLWDIASGKELGRFAEPAENRVAAVLLLPDKSILFIGARRVGRDGVGLASIRDPATGKELRRIAGLDAALTAAALSPDGKTLVAAEENGPVRVVDLATGAELARWPASARTLAVSPDGTVVAGSTGTARVHLWHAATGKPLHDRPTHASQAFGLAFTPDGKSLVSATRDDDVRVWDAATGKQRFRLDPAGPREIGWRGVAVHSTDRMLTSGGAAAVRVWEAATGREVAAVGLGEMRQPLAVQVQPGGKAVAAVGYLPGDQPQHGFLVGRVVDLATGKVLSNLAVATDENAWHACFPALSPDGTRVVYGLGFGQVLVACDLATGKNQIRIEPPDGSTFQQVAFSPDGSVLATHSRTRKGDAEWEAHARLFDAATGKEVRAFPVPDGGWLAFSPTGRTFAVAQGRRLSLLDATTGKELWRSATLDAWLGGLAFSPDGKTLATGMSDGTILLWDVPQAR